MENIKIHKIFNKNPGIYCINHIPTGKKYVGSTSNLRRRIYEHINNISSSMHCNSNIKNISKSIEEFEFSCLKEMDKNSTSFELEQEEQKFLNTGEFNLNVRKIAQISNLGKTYEEIYGLELAIIIKKKLSESHKGIKYNIQGLKEYWTKERKLAQAESFRNKKRGRRDKKKVQLINIVSNEIYLFDTMKDAVIFSKVSRSGLFNVLNKNKSTKGFVINIVNG